MSTVTPDLKKETTVPQIPEPTPGNLLAVVKAIKEVLEVREGITGDPLDQMLTARDLYAMGLLQHSAVNRQIVARLPGYGVVFFPPSPKVTPEYAPPPAPTGFTADGALANVILTWNKAAYHGHAYTEVWRAGTDNFTNAVLVGTTDGSLYADNLGQTGATRYYWIRYVSQTAVPGPFNATAGTVATTGFIVEGNIADASITTQKLADGSVVTVKLGDLAVTSTKIGDSQVTEAKIGDAAVTTNKVGDSTITAAKIGDLQVTETKLVDGSVSTAKLGDSAVTTQKIGDSSITKVKFGSGLSPVEKVSSLPTLPDANYPQSQVVMLTTDNKLYRSTGSTWTAAVPTVDLTGQITEPQIADAAVTSNKVGAAAIELEKFAANLRPVQVVETLPVLPHADYPSDEAVVFLASDRKLYRNSTAEAASVFHSGTAQAGGKDALALAAGAPSSLSAGSSLRLSTGPGSVQQQPVTSYGVRASYLSLPGTSGNYASTPDSAAVSITGDIDIRVKVAMDDWTPAAISTILAKYQSVGGNQSYFLNLNTTGHPIIGWHETSGGPQFTRTATVAPSVADGEAIWLRATLDVDNGAGGHDAKFYTSNDGESWSQLGATVTVAGVTAIFDGSAPVQISSFNEGAGSQHLDGKVYYAEVRNGIGGTVVAKFDPLNAGADVGDTSLTASTGEVWTINQSGSPAAELTDVGAKVATVSPGWGLSGFSIKGAGSTEKVQLGSKYTFSGHSWSIEFWSSHTDDLSRHGFFQRSGGVFPGVYLGRDLGGVTAVRIVDSSGNAARATANSPVDEAAHFVGTYDHTTKTVKIYKNGQFVAENTNASITNVLDEASHANPLIGARDSIGPNYGTVDGVRLYIDRVLNDDEVAEHHDAVFNDETGIVGKWEFDEGTGTTTADSAGSNDGTLTDGPTWADPLAITLPDATTDYEVHYGAWTAAVQTTDLIGQITETQITDSAISTPKLAANAVTATKIAAGTITSAEIAAGTIVAGNIAAAAIGATEIAANAVVADKIAANAVVAGKLAAASVAAGNIATNAIIAGDGVIATAAIGTALIQDGAIVNAKIGNLAVDAAKIADAAIVNAKIADATIDGAKIANAAIVNAKIADATIDGAKIANAAIGDAKITNLSGTKITAASIAVDKLSIAQLAAITADMGAITAGTVTLNSTGHIKSGQTAYNTGVGFWLGIDSGDPKFSIGDAANDYLRWDPEDGFRMRFKTFDIELAEILSMVIASKWRVRTTPKNFGLQGVVWNGSIFCAVGLPDGFDAYLITSPNGVAWTERANPKNIALQDVCWSSALSLFIAVGNSDGFDTYLLTSPTGTTWTERSNPKAVGLLGCAAAADVVVAVGFADGSDAYLISSTNGTSWTERSNPKNIALQDVCYSPELDLFVAVGNPDGTDAYIVTSPDGVTWTERSNPKNIALWGVTWSPELGLFVAVGSQDGTDSYIVTSPNGSTWTERAAPKNKHLNAVVWNGSIFVACGNTDVGGDDCYMVTSSNGIDWTEVETPQNRDLDAIEWNGKTFVAVGQQDATDPDGGSLTAHVITSLVTV